MTVVIMVLFLVRNQEDSSQFSVYSGAQSRLPIGFPQPPSDSTCTIIIAVEVLQRTFDLSYALLDVDTSQFGVMDFRGYGSGLELDGPQPIQVKIIDAGQATGEPPHDAVR